MREYRMSPTLAMRGREKYAAWQQAERDAQRLNGEFKEFSETVAQAMSLPRLRKGKQWTYHVDRGVLSDQSVPPASASRSKS